VDSEGIGSTFRAFHMANLVENVLSRTAPFSQVGATVPTQSPAGFPEVVVVSGGRTAILSLRRFGSRVGSCWAP